MKNLGKFSFYTPEELAVPKARHIQNEQGLDWYTISWDKERVAKNIYAGADDNGHVIAITEDGAMFFPANMIAWEIPKDEAPDSILAVGYNATIIEGKYAVDYAGLAGKTQQSLLKAANAMIKDWRAELLLNVISDDDKASLIKWMAYIKALKALDFTNVTDEVAYQAISWPEQPQE